MSEIIYHHGIKGQKWGVRRFQNEDGTLTTAGKKRYADDFSYAEESSVSIKKNSDGSETIPKGFKFNRVGKQTFDPNASGALYVSYGKQDAARYVKSLGPTFLGKLLGTAGDTIQHISVKSDLKMASYEQTAFETASFLKKQQRSILEIQ